MITDFPIFNYPTNSYTDGTVLYESLGSFWTQIFQERDTLKGYTLSQAEELIQHYYNLLETINSYSVKDVPVFHKEKWFPIAVKKSEYNNIPLLFRAVNDPEKAVFGPQPSNDTYYAGVTFKFGFPKTPVAEVYGIVMPDDLAKFSVICNRVINPSVVFVNDVDVRSNGDILYFNKDIFSMAEIPKFSLLDETGQPVYYTTKEGAKLQDEMVILWAYHAEFDKELLYSNFGYVFELNMKNDQFYKDVLKSSFDLFTGGPTVRNVRSLACSFLGVKPVIETQELVEDIYTQDGYRFVITDKNVYKADDYYNVLPEVIVGSPVYAGDVLFNAAQYFDYVHSREWWRNALVPKAAYDSSNNITKYPEMAFPPYLFVGTYSQSLIFKNDFEIVTRSSAGVITFPVHGTAADVAEFNKTINLNASEIGDKLGLASGSSIVLNPLDFLFQNFLKHNTSLIKFNFPSLKETSTFMKFYNVVKDIFPKHVYVMFFFDFDLTQDVVDTLNGKSTVYASTSTTGTITATNGTYNLTVTAHPFVVGDVVRITSNGVNPTGIDERFYQVLTVVNANTIQIAELGSDTAVTVTSIGSGTVTIRKYVEKTVSSDGSHASTGVSDLVKEGRLETDPGTTNFKSTVSRLFALSKGINLFTANGSDILTGVDAPNNTQTVAMDKVVSNTAVKDGKVSVSINPVQTGAGSWTCSGTTITGSGTNFQTLLQPGYYLYDPVSKKRREITAIASNTSMTIKSTWSVNSGSAPYSYQKPDPSNRDISNLLLLDYT